MGKALDGMGAVGSNGRAYHALGRACLLLDKIDDASRFGRRSVESAGGQQGVAAHVQHLFGDIATHTDRCDPDIGETPYRQALTLAEQRGMRPLVAHCHLGLGQLYRRTSTSDRAKEHLTTATTMYREMDMRFWQEKAEAAWVQVEGR